MSDYIKITDYAAKDALLTGNPAKLVKGTEIGADFDAVAVAVATKYDATDLGVTVQAYDADLTTWAGVTPGTGIATALAVNVGTAGAPVINGGALGTPSSGTLTNATGLPAAGVTGTALVAAAIGTTVLGIAGGNLTGGINSARGNITQHATTMDFFAVTSPDILDGTGSAVTITACVNAPQAGATRKFYPIVATVLTHGATFDIVGNANLTAAAGDCWIIEAKTVSTYRVTLVREDGLPVAFIDEDSMASDSAVLVPSQQSVKAYVDAQASAGITLGTPVASTSGTSIDFTSIPAGTKRITVMFDGVSTNGTSPVQVQIGDSGGIEATGYLGASSRSGSVSAANNSAGFLFEDSGAASVVRHGSLTLSLLSSSANIWTANGNVGRSDSANLWSQGGSKPLSATLDRVRITTVGGTETFDAGTINISYE